MWELKMSMYRSSSSWETGQQLLVSSFLYLLHFCSAASFGKGTVVVGGEAALKYAVGEPMRK
jgi:hypothetical protein